MLQTAPLQLNLPSAFSSFAQAGPIANAASCGRSGLGWSATGGFAASDVAMFEEDVAREAVVSVPEIEAGMKTNSRQIPMQATRNTTKLPTLALSPVDQKPLQKSVVIVNRPLESIQTPHEKLQSPFQILVHGSAVAQSSNLVAKMNLTNSNFETMSLITSVSQETKMAQFNEIPKLQSSEDASSHVQFLVYDGYGTSGQKVVGVSVASPIHLVPDVNTRKNLLCKKIWKNAGGNSFVTSSRVQWSSLETELLKQCRMMLGLGTRPIQSQDLNGITQSIRYDCKGAVDMKQFQANVWDRVYVFTRLITQILLPFWNQGLVFGFTSRTVAEAALAQAASEAAKDGKPKRIGLIRFSETQHSSAVVGACDVLASGKVGPVMWAKLDLQSLETPSSLATILSVSNITHLVDTLSKSAIPMDASIYGKSSPASSGRAEYTLFPRQMN